jgi:PPE family
MARELQARTYLWMGTGAVGLGIAAALASGSGVAQADSTSSSSPGPSKPAHHQAAASPSHSTASSVTSSVRKNSRAKHPAVVSSAVGLPATKAEKSTAAADDPSTEQAQAIAAQRAVIVQEQQVVGQEVRSVVGNFTALSPEVNAAHLYSGIGSASLVEAAAAWNGLAGQLNSAAVSLKFVSSLPFLGPGSTALTQPAVTWLTTTAGQTELMAVQASTAADFYQSAFTATVSPAALVANRGVFNTLVATNFLGINNPMIALTEVEYLALFAQGGFRPFSGTPT